MKVAIIGAGVSGLFSIKSCLEEGLKPTCFEKTNEIGGGWVYKADYKDGDPAGVYQGLLSNTTNIYMEASDFPTHITEQFPPWQKHLEYTQKYAKHFSLEQYISFKSEVVSVVPEEDDWLVKWRTDEEEKEEVFNAVLVCSGRFHKPVVPDFPGRERFTGSFITANQYKSDKQENIVDKRVMIIGNSYTAADISTLVANSAKQVYLSIGKGSTVLGCMVDDMPMEYLFNKRGFVYNKNFMSMLREVLERCIHQTFSDHEEYGITPGGDYLSRPFLFTRQDLPSSVRNGRILVKPLVEDLTENGVRLKTGEELELDTIIIATGYDIHYPFFSKEILADTVSELELYRLMWPLTTRRPNLAMIGCVKILGAFSPFLELQARWATMVIQGKCKLASREEMVQEIKTRKESLMYMYGKSEAQTDLPVVAYQDWMAYQIGAMPMWYHYILTNPSLAACIRTGPPFASGYRLTGPHACPGASKRLLELYRHYQKLRGESWQDFFHSAFWKGLMLLQIGTLTYMVLNRAGFLGRK